MEIEEGIKIEKWTSKNGNDVLIATSGVVTRYGEEALEYISYVGSEQEKELALKINAECRKAFSIKNWEKVLPVEYRTIEFGAVCGDSYDRERDQRSFFPCDPDWEPTQLGSYVEPHNWNDDGYESHEESETWLLKIGGKPYIVIESHYVTFNGEDIRVEAYKLPLIKN